ncbi:amino acid racemase [Paraburkholderia xenovorans]|uniref:aspartate/glutamate racemase family protein n=1 Tax=Paraburkholderia xenovorans TaxID=36873 RepID=UPI0038BCAB40
MSKNPRSEEMVIGVLGGMGPQAGIDFLSKLVAATPFTCEQDHLHVLLDSNPKVPDRNRAIAAAYSRPLRADENPGNALAAMAQRLEVAGADLLVMACNTAHAFQADIRAATRVPFVSIVDEACDAVVRETPGVKRVGILATQGCISAELYQQALLHRRCEPLLLPPQRQERCMQLIYQIKLGGISNELTGEMIELARALTIAGADAIIAGCTEIPLILHPGMLPCTLIDATANLARQCVRYARRLAPLPLSCFSNQ